MKSYRTVQGDTWDGIAFQQLGSTAYTDQLVQANPDYVDTFFFPAGITLVLPEIKRPVSETLPPWKR